jgi:hypothetical protein
MTGALIEADCQSRHGTSAFDYAAYGANWLPFGQIGASGGHTENHAVSGCENGCIALIFKPLFAYRNHVFLVY